ncbi:MAG: ABC transporter substrate-binding protein [Burkholderiaceae bacterium]|jgi:ABC-type transport system substrate-binding protein|nr:ABC transporter substrate-binding protein [Burkholderiaceae bacterium]
MKKVSIPRRDALRSLALLPAAAALPAGAQGSAVDSARDSGRPKVLRYAFRVAETGFDPAQVNDLYSSTVISNIFDAPLTYDFLSRPARVVPNTAESLPQMSADFTSLTFRIRRGIYFQDHPAFKGEQRELVAQDYVYAIKRVYDPKYKSPRVYLLENAKILGMSEIRAAALKGAKFDYDREVEGIRALDRYTFQLRFGEPNPRFHLYLADNSFLGAVAREVCEMYDEKQIMGHPVGTGPFRLVDWRRSSRIVLERNPGYRDDRYDAQAPADDPRSVQIAGQLRGRKLPLVDRVEVFIVDENQPRWLAFLNEEHDLVDEVPYDLADIVIPGGQLAPALKRRNVQVDRALRAVVDLALFNCEHPVIGGYTPDKVALRRAVSLAYNVDEEIRLVRRGQSIPSNSPVAPTVPGFDPQFRSEMSVFSRTRAKALLDAFGYVDRDGDGWREMPDGRPLLLEMATQPDQLSRQLDELWRKSMTAIGVRLEFRPAKWPENLKNSRAGRLMMWRVGWSAAQPDGDTFLALGYGPNKGQANHARFDLPAFNKLYAVQKTLPDGPEREQLYFDAKKMFVAWAPYKFVGHRIETSVSHPWVIGFRRHPFMRDFWKYVDIDAEQQARARA